MPNQLVTPLPPWTFTTTYLPRANVTTNTNNKNTHSATSQQSPPRAHHHGAPSTLRTGCPYRRRRRRPLRSTQDLCVTATPRRRHHRRPRTMTVSPTPLWTRCSSSLGVGGPRPPTWARTPRRPAPRGPPSRGGRRRRCRCWSSSRCRCCRTRRRRRPGRLHRHSPRRR